MSIGISAIGMSITCHHDCCKPVAASQSLDEMEFERGIWSSALSGDVDGVNEFLRKSVHPDKKDSAGYTALHYASRNGHLNVCKVLIENGANINETTKGGATALSRAAFKGRRDVVEYLLSKKADPLVQDCDGRTALHRAAESAELEICDLLLEAAPSLRHVIDKKGEQPNLSFHALLK